MVHGDNYNDHPVRLTERKNGFPEPESLAILIKFEK